MPTLKREKQKKVTLYNGMLQSTVRVTNHYQQKSFN